MGVLVGASGSKRGHGEWGWEQRQESQPSGVDVTEVCLILTMPELSHNRRRSSGR